MAARLRVVILCLLVTPSLQGDPERNQHGVPKDKSSDLVGTFGTYLTNELGNTAIGTSHFETHIHEKGGSGYRVSEGGYVQDREVMTNLASTLSKRLNDKIEAVQDIANAVSETLNSGKKATEEYHQCCKMPKKYKLTYDPRFKDKITFEVVCQMKAPNHIRTPQPNFKKVKTAFDNNMENPSMKVRWQYFGSREGILTGYPSSVVSSCHSYDNRLRPWYVTTATPSPKNIIILLDCSTSMGFYNALEAAKDSAKVVLNTLHPLDKVSVILFNASTYLSGDKNTDECYSTQMAFAGTFNVKHLKSFIDSARPKGGTRFVKAFQKALEILKNTFNTSLEPKVSRPSMILLLTNEGPKTTAIEEIVVGAVNEEFQKFRNEYKDATLKLLTMSFGTDGRNNAFLDKLTKATNGISMSAQGKTDSHSKLKPYFDYLMEVIPAQGANVVFSPPYLDAWGLGYMITAANAVFVKGDSKFRGVVGIDILMTDLVSDVQYFRRGSLKSYAFMFDSKTGITMSHPKLPTPESVTEDSYAVNILELEPGEEFLELFNNVQKTALTGGQVISTKVIQNRKLSVSRGGVEGDGVKVERVNYRYSCKPLNVPNTDAEREVKEYIACIAIKDMDADDKFSSALILSAAGSHPLAYHRIDVISEAKTCYHIDTLSYSDRSVLKLNAKAFVDPAGYFEEEERPSAIRRYLKQLYDESHNFQMYKGKGLHKNIPSIALLTSNLDRIVWNSGSAKFKEYTTKFVRRFVGTYDGVLRIFPGAPLPTNFDHVTRPWFLTAVANEGMTAVTHPYFDPLGAGFIVSVSHTVTLPAAINNSHKVYAVMGGDLTISSFGASVLKTMGPKCIKNGKLQCFLMDTSGYIVYHPNFENVYNDSSKVVGRHITEMVSTIAQDLIKNGFMKRRACKNFNLYKLQRYYEIEVNTPIYEGKASSSHGGCNSYTIARIEKTNVFVVRVRSTTCFTHPTSCPCLDTCTSDENEACECPCKSRLEYNICNANLTGARDIPVCGQPSPPVANRKPIPEHPDDLGQCIKANCGKYKTKLDCNEIFGCVWCYKRISDGSLLKHPSCKRDRECYGGELGRPNPFLLPFKARKPKKHVKLLRFLGLEFTLKTLIITATSIGVGLLVLIVFIWCLCKSRNKWTLDLDEIFGEEDVAMMNFPDPGQSTMHMGQGMSTVHMGQRMSTMQMGQRTSTMHMENRQSTMHMGNRQSAMHMANRQSAMHMAQRPSAMHMGQRPSNMQMRLNAPGVQYSTQAMWSQAYGQSQLMNYVPQVNTMQTPGAMASPGKMAAHNRKVSFSADVQDLDDYEEDF